MRWACRETSGPECVLGHAFRRRCDARHWRSRARLSGKFAMSLSIFLECPQFCRNLVGAFSVIALFGSFVMTESGSQGQMVGRREVEWLISPRELPKGTQLQVSSLIEADRLTPEVLELLGKLAKELQQQKRDKPDPCPKLTACTAFHSPNPCTELTVCTDFTVKAL
jgi:hypothetical protein